MIFMQQTHRQRRFVEHNLENVQCNERKICLTPNNVLGTMKTLSTHRVIHSPSSQFTLGVVLALTLFSLTVNAQTVVRTGTGGAVFAPVVDVYGDHVSPPSKVRRKV